MVAQLLDEDPERAYEYSRIALRLASRVAAVREAAGFAAYAVAKYAEALAEFRAARRMTGSTDLWPVMADCERGLGRPERALAMAGEPEVQKLDRAGQVEMRLVVAGARRDMGQIEAAVVTLQSSELASSAIHPWTARLRYAYADALLAAEREDEAREWFAKALEADQGGTTDASDRLAELDGVEFVDALETEDGEEPAEWSEQPVARDLPNDDDRDLSQDYDEAEDLELSEGRDPSDDRGLAEGLELQEGRDLPEDLELSENVAADDVAADDDVAGDVADAADDAPAEVMADAKGSAADDGGVEGADSAEDADDRDGSAGGGAARGLDEVPNGDADAAADVAAVDPAAASDVAADDGAGGGVVRSSGAAESSVTREVEEG